MIQPKVTAVALTDVLITTPLQATATEPQRTLSETSENNRLLPLIEKLFGWGIKGSFNEVDLATKSLVEASMGYCKHRK